MTEIRHPLPDVYAAGQPSAGQLASLAGEGVRTVINLRAPTEPAEFDEAVEAGRLGVRYVSIPIAGSQDVTPETAAQFSRELEKARRLGSVLVHCASANRVGAMLALDQCMSQNKPMADALSIGRAAGLTTLEPAVTEILVKRSIEQGAPHDLPPVV